MSSKSYDAFLIEQLRDPELAAEYLTSALEEGSTEQFLLALRAIAEAHGGIGVIAEITDLNRQSMYKMLSADGNPTLTNLLAVLRAVGVSLTFAPAEKLAA